VLRWTGFPISETRIAFWVAMIEWVSGFDWEVWFG